MHVCDTQLSRKVKGLYTNGSPFKRRLDGNCAQWNFRPLTDGSRYFIPCRFRPASPPTSPPPLDTWASRRKTRRMDSTIIASLIGAVATITAAQIAVSRARHSEAPVRHAQPPADSRRAPSPQDVESSPTGWPMFFARLIGITLLLGLTSFVARGIDRPGEALVFLIPTWVVGMWVLFRK